jgi:hypothetical protein
MILQHIDREKNPPTLATLSGAAWLLDEEALAQKHGPSAVVRAWIFFAPWAHPLWSYYTIGGLHLRPQPPLPPPKIAIAGATHEVYVAAMNPEEIPDLFLDSRQLLHPFNFVAQWKVPERPNPVDLDRGARAKIDKTVQEILAGELNPDTDGRRGWIERFGEQREG